MYGSNTHRFTPGIEAGPLDSTATAGSSVILRSVEKQKEILLKNILTIEA